MEGAANTGTLAHGDASTNGDAPSYNNNKVNGNRPNGKSNGESNGVMNGHSKHPFRYSLYPTVQDRLLWLLMAFTLAPFKLVFVIIFLLLASTAARIAVIGLPLEPPHPLSGWRLVFRDLTVFFTKCAGFAAGVVYQTVKGRQASSKEAPLLIMAPHTSSLDPLAGALVGLPGAVSMTDNARYPLIGAIFRANQSIFVERGDPDSRNKAAEKIRMRAKAKGAWPQLIVLPEGFCSNGQSLQPFKLGAFVPGVSVQPMTVKYNNKRLDATSWVDTGPGLIAMWSLLLVTPITKLEVELHPVYHPSEEEKKDPELFAKNVRELMSRYLNLPTSELTYRDLKSLVINSKQHRLSILGLWKSVITKGYVEMPSKEHLS